MVRLNVHCCLQKENALKRSERSQVLYKTEARSQGSTAPVQTCFTKDKYMIFGWCETSLSPDRNSYWWHLVSSKHQSMPLAYAGADIPEWPTLHRIRAIKVSKPRWRFHTIRCSASITVVDQGSNFGFDVPRNGIKSMAWSHFNV